MIVASALTCAEMRGAPFHYLNESVNFAPASVGHAVFNIRYK